ncbi:MAG: GNAT family N-acetyltransferase [Myxococcota bacterium]
MACDTEWSEGGVQVVKVHDVQTLRDNLAACAAGFDREVQLPNDLHREVELCTGPDARNARFVAYAPDGEPVGSANVTVHAGRFGFLWAGATVPAWRGRGVYRALLGARCRWARSNGLDRVGLYANRATSAPVVAGLGFTKHGPMAYWARTPQTGSPPRS